MVKVDLVYGEIPYMKPTAGMVGIDLNLETSMCSNLYLWFFFQFSTYFPGYFDGQYWLWWVFLVLGECLLKGEQLKHA